MLICSPCHRCCSLTPRCVLTMMLLCTPTAHFAHSVGRPCTKIDIVSSLPEAPYCQEFVDRLQSDIEREMQAQLGTLHSELDLTEATLRSRESAAGNWIADVLKDSLESDVALINGGGIRADCVMPAGTAMTIKHVYDMFPFEDSVCLVHISGGTSLAIARACIGAHNSLDHTISSTPSFFGRKIPSCCWYESGIRLRETCTAPGVLCGGGRPAFGSQPNVQASHMFFSRSW